MRINCWTILENAVELPWDAKSDALQWILGDQLNCRATERKFRKRTSGGSNSIIVCHDKVMTFTLPLYGLLTRPNNKRHML